MQNQADFHILGETADYLAVNKPAGLLVHPSKPGGPHTLWDGLRDLLGYELATGGQISIINRLDRETSGVVIVAKTFEAARTAGIAMQRREMKKRYLALVFGWPEWEEITIDSPICRRGEVEESLVWLERMVHPSGQPATTCFHVLGRHSRNGEPFALLEAEPLTGRTHQIRVHAASLGFPVIGDKLYARGRDKYLRFIDEGWTDALAADLWLPRHALHCASMIFGASIWEAPLPDDLSALTR